MNLVKTLGIIILVAALILGILGTQPATGPHGGTMKKAEENFIEMNSSGNYFYCWLLDSKANPISNENITCEVKFVFPDSSIIDIKAFPFDKDGFSIENAGVFSTARITFHVQGNSVSATFESSNPIVKKK